MKNEDDKLNFICPLCKVEVSEEEAEQDNVFFDVENKQFFHVKCLQKEEDKLTQDKSKKE